MNGKNTEEDDDSYDAKYLKVMRIGVYGRIKRQIERDTTMQGYYPKSKQILCLLA